MTLHRFSIENVFRVNSISNIFVDLVRDFKEKQMDTNVECRGLLSAEEDWDTLYIYMEILCEQVLAIIRNEPKILRLTAPIYIFGDIQGSLNDLFTFENNIFHSVPVLSVSMLFLGNYSGNSFPYGIECIIYMFALKVAMPNKIYLLRGRNELRSFNQSTLGDECKHKYGSKYGPKLFELVNHVFDTMPVAATIDDSVFCTHSGIPRMVTGKKLIQTISSHYSTAAFVEIQNPEQVFPIAYEVRLDSILRPFRVNNP